MKKGKLRVIQDGSVAFYCPGCECYHTINISDPKTAIWTFNNDYEKPTFVPSVLIRSGHHIPGHQGRCWCDYNREHPEEPIKFGCSVCHTYVTDGKIQYLGDCTHALAGQTIDIPDKD